MLHWCAGRCGAPVSVESQLGYAVGGDGAGGGCLFNIHSVKLFAHHDQELSYAKGAIRHARSTFAQEMRIVTKMDLALTLLNGFLIVSVTGWAVALWVQGSATAGTVAAATALVLRLNNMTYWIMWAFTSLVQALGVVQEGMETIAQPVTLVDAPQAKRLDFQKGKVEIQGVSHHYGRGSGGLQDVSLTVRPGEIGLIGRSGAGKSTLVKLMLRFYYDCESGRILIDGQDIARVTQESLRLQIGMVQRDSSLMHRSVRENILYGRPDAGEEAMIAAAKQAEAHDFILTLEDPEGRKGYDARMWANAGSNCLAGSGSGGAGAGDPEGCADPDPGRGDLGPGQRSRGGHPGGALRRRDGGQDGDRDCAPAFDHRGDGPDRGAGRRPYR